MSAKNFEELGGITDFRYSDRMQKDDVPKTSLKLTLTRKGVEK
jgi:hypothetical protein